MLESLTVAHCRACGRTGHLTLQDAGFWCAWCATAVEVELRAEEAVPRATVLRLATVDGQLVDPEALPLQPLRVTDGWRMAYNGALYALDPTPENVAWWWIFKQDMMIMVHERRGRLLDLGWTEEGSWEHGAYRLVLHEGTDHRGRALFTWDGRNRPELVRTIEWVLDRVSAGAL